MTKIDNYALLVKLLVVSFIIGADCERNSSLDWFSANARLHNFQLRRDQSNENRDKQDEARRISAQESSALFKLGETFFTPSQLEETMSYFFLSQDDKKFANYTLREFAYMGANVKLLSQAWSDLYLHRYDTYRDMKFAAGPQVDQELCLRQLEHLSERAQLNLELGLETTDMDFARYIDTFGRVPAGMFMGHAYWIGSYEECKRLHINLPGSYRTKTRYCVASFRFKSWPKNDPLHNILVFKTGVCLPEACDSVKYKNKHELIARIIEFNARQIDLGTIDSMELYCLPDEQSQMRAWWRSKPTMMMICCTGMWIVALIYATHLDALNKRRTTDLGKLSKSTKIGLSNGFKATSAASDTLATVYRSLSITNNLKSLFSTEKSSLLEVGEAAAGKKRLANETVDKPEVEAGEMKRPKNEAPAKIVDLDVLEGVKVLAAIYIISGHVLLLASQLPSNGRDLATTHSVVYAISNLMPAFAVNAFFAITGILTSYLMFKQNQSHSFITSPLKWVAFILYRYLRIMPLYALVTLFCKHVSRFTGEGPHWDYGTSSLAARRNCEQESWAWTLLFGANFKSPLKHCIPSAWYLANDFQFFIVTPIFLAVLHKRPQVGKMLLMLATLASYLAGVWSILATEAPDLRPIANFMPHGFTVYVNFLHESYTRPYYRAPAYLIGLLLGHMLFEFELKKRNHLQDKAPEERDPAEPNWSNGMLRYGPWFSGSIVALIIATPSIGSRLPLDPTSARILVALFMPTFHILYALAVGVYVLLSTTGNGSATMDWLLSRHFWKPMARLSLCVVLVNVEVIANIVQSSRDSKYMNNQYLAMLNLYVLVWTYTVAAIVCILFEAPIRAALNNLLAYAVNRLAAKIKKTQ